MKNTLRIFTLCLSILITQQLSFGQVTKKQLEKTFDDLQALVAGKGETCGAANTVVGDLDGDGDVDGIVQYACTMHGGNIVVRTGWTVWLNDGKKLKPILTERDLVGTWPRAISNGVILARFDKHKRGDASCCPSIKIPKKYKLVLRKLVNIQWYELQEVK